MSLISVVFLLATNAFFVAAEFALVKARGFRIDTLAEHGNASAIMTQKIQQNLEAYLAACQLGITMASLGLGWVGEPTIAALLEPVLASFGLPEAAIHTIAFLTGFLIFSSLHIIVGEQVPKTFAIRKPEAISLMVAYPLHWSYIAVYPFNWMLNKTSGWVLKQFGVEEASHGDILTGDEIKGLVKASHEHGEIEFGKARMLRNLFEFDERRIGRVMIPIGSTYRLDLAADFNENLKVIRESGHSRFPVIDSNHDDEIKGLLLVKDIYSALLDGVKEPWSELAKYCREPLVIPETQRVSKLFELMRVRRAHMAFVVDEYGKFSGIVTLEDLLEEIVGEILDETDTDENMIDIQSIAENKWEAYGLVSITDLGRATGYRPEDSMDANTISGLFLQKLQRMPKVNDSIEDRGYQFTILSIEDRHIGRVTIEKIIVDITDITGD
ncbi:MAG: hemolysin family protein [Methylophilaceae bacterium]